MAAMMSVEFFPQAAAEWDRIRANGYSILTSHSFRSMRDFAESEIIIPDGPFRGLPFRCDRQPWVSLWFGELDSGRWQRHVATGPSQSGKTLGCYIIPVMYHLFEVGETVVCGVPKMEMARDKWERDFLPAIEASRFRELMPLRGKGSRGGSFDSITFRNGSTLKFMTGGGDDKSRAGFTARVLAVTEVDGFDVGSDLSREANPIAQLEARLLAYGHRKRVYLECTVSYPSGRIWTEYESGSASQIKLQCPHCAAWVQPEREHFIGWDAAPTEIEAEDAGAFFCPNCATAWNSEHRVSANRGAILVHRGQQVSPDGQIVGPTPPTRTFGFRWTSTNNLFVDEKLLGAKEWKAARSLDRDSAEKEMTQFFWTSPYTGANTELELTEKIIASRLTGLPRGVVPNDAETFVVAIDVHNKNLFWCALATAAGSVRSIVDYNIFNTPNPEINGPERAIALGLEQLADELTDRRWETESGDHRPIDLHLVDAGYRQEISLRFVTDRGSRWRLSKGSGDGFKLPKDEFQDDVVPGNHWALHQQPACEESGGCKWWLTLTDTDFWLRQVHAGFICEPLQSDGTRRPGSVALFGDDQNLHLSPVDRTVSRSAFATQILAWRWQATNSPKRGEIMSWVSQFREDHWLDVLYGCFVADSLQQAINAEEQEAARRSPVRVQDFTRPDGRPWFPDEADFRGRD